ncbi:hypothetical protein [Robbsia sp. KACC 23696]|uniref:hypothetical protein n=1 Tax=Robbsia sp. KACC 23696 TaxID=3149231 RepID=UPI00325BE27C
MNALPSHSLLETLVQDEKDGTEPAAHVSFVCALHAMPSDVRLEIWDRLDARSITRLASVNVGMRHASREHPVILAFAQIGKPSRYASLIGGQAALAITVDVRDAVIH